MDGKSNLPDSQAPPIRAAGYVRVSTEEQNKHGWNLGADRERIEKTITDRGWARVAIYDDGGRQGDDPTRPDYLRMLAEVDDYDVIVMRDLDRLGRKTALSAVAYDAFKDANVLVHEFYGDEGTGTRITDLDNEDDRALADIKAAFAQLEKAKIKKRVRQAKAARARAGGHHGGKRIYGYHLVDTGRKGAHDRPINEMRPHPTERLVVKRIFEMAPGTSQRKIAHALNAESIPTSRGARWTQASVRRVLSNPVYIGKVRRRKLDGEWELFDGRHEAIVGEALWEKVSRTMGAPERRAGGRPMVSSHLLTRGMLRCGSCGSAMIPIFKDDRPDVYICVGRRDHGADFCRQPSMRRDLIDGALLDELTSRYLDLDGARDRLRERLASELPLSRAALREAEHEFLAVNADARLARIKRGWQEDVLSDEEYRAQTADVEDERDAAQAAVQQAQARLEQIETGTVTTDAEEALLRHLADLKQAVSGAVDAARDVESLRMVIRQLFDHIELVEWPGFGTGTSEGVLTGEENPAVTVGEQTYGLVPYMRAEMVDTDLRPVKAALPEKPNSWTCQRS